MLCGSCAHPEWKTTMAIERAHCKMRNDILRSFSRSRVAAKSISVDPCEIELWSEAFVAKEEGISIAVDEVRGRFLARPETEPDDARDGDEITHAILMCVGHHHSFRLILHA